MRHATMLGLVLIGFVIGLITAGAMESSQAAAQDAGTAPQAEYQISATGGNYGAYVINIHTGEAWLIGANGQTNKVAEKMP